MISDYSGDDQCECVVNFGWELLPEKILSYESYDSSYKSDWSDSIFGGAGLRRVDGCLNDSEWDG